MPTQIRVRLLGPAKFQRPVRSVCSPSEAGLIACGQHVPGCGLSAPRTPRARIQSVFGESRSGSHRYIQPLSLKIASRSKGVVRRSGTGFGGAMYHLCALAMRGRRSFAT